MRADILKNSIGTKIFAAFAAMSVLIAALGVYAFSVLSSSGAIVVDTYDGPLMATSYARAASLDFALMQKKFLEREIAPSSKTNAIDDEIAQHAANLFDDLNVAEERSRNDEERAVAKEIAIRVHEWMALPRARLQQADIDRGAALDARILDRFDFLIELNADHGYVSRRKAVDAIAAYKYAIAAATSLAVILAIVITFFLVRLIVRPLSSAARVADRIAGGELQTPIPQGRKDETGVLLKSMTVMQDNILAMMAREASLRLTAESRLVDALESAREGVLLVGQSGKIVVANSELAQFFPTLAGNLLDGAEFLSLAEMAFGAFRNPKKARAHARALQDCPQGVSRGMNYPLRDGRWLRFTANRTRDGGFILFASDFTKIKQREEDYLRAKQQAEAASAAKSRFLANMSHELRTPLNAIIGFSEIISREILGPITDRNYVEYATDILRGGRHLLDVINSVLDIARHDAGKIVLKLETVDLRYILMDCLKMVHSQIEDAGLTLDVSGLDDAILVPGEKAKLRQIFLNLFSNAIKFTERGGKVSLQIRRSPAAMTVEVADTGIGMSSDDIQIALSPFGQVDNRLQRRYEGTGLGLPLTKALVDLHNAKMNITSAKGGGTVVKVTFPLAQPLELPTSLAG